MSTRYLEQLSRRLSMRRRSNPAPVRAWPAALLAGAFLLLCLASGARVWVSDRGVRETSIQDELRARLAEADRRADSAKQIQPPGDFTQSLPKSISVDGFVQTLQRSARAFNVSMLTIHGEPRNETPTTLPELDVGITLRGSYPDLKSTLSEALSRYPNAVLQHVALRRDATVPGSEEATIQLMLPLRPRRADAAY